jgi:hypothetical protein
MSLSSSNNSNFNLVEDSDEENSVQMVNDPDYFSDDELVNSEPCTSKASNYSGGTEMRKKTNKSDGNTF